MRGSLVTVMGLCALASFAQPRWQPLDEGWRFRELGTARWWTATVPGTVHQDLLRAGRIPDPLRNANSDSVRWVELRDWEYAVRFEADAAWAAHPQAQLVFKGIDTFADVRLNGVRLGGADNMFRTWSWPVHGIVREGPNDLHVVLRSPVREGAQLRAAYGIQLPHDSDPSGTSPYVRKAAYQFGWDFAPRLVTMGIWKEVTLELPAAPVPRAQPSVSLDQRADSIGRAFRFMRNGRPLFIKGCNLVPPSMFPGPDSLWVARVRDMQRAGMNMVRVWAGGVYPPDAFYAACDTAGILVWQDLMFANIPPAEGAFPDNVRAEVADQAGRLGRWSGLALWCGNNELEVAWHNWGWQDRYRIHGPDSVRVRDAMHRFFGKDLVEALPDDQRQRYTPTSPLSNWGNATGLRNGDLHYWGVWHGDSAFSSFSRNVGRFVSEYGFQSYPDSVTLATQLDPQHLHLGDPLLAARQRSYKTDRPILDAIDREFGVRPRTLGELIRFSQLAQAEAYRQAIWAHLTAQPHCMGTLFWQLNDVWAGPSWSTVDHLGTWKAAMYEVARSYRSVVLDLRQEGGDVVARIWNEDPDRQMLLAVTEVFDTDGRSMRSDSLWIQPVAGVHELVRLPVTAALAGSPPERTLVHVRILDHQGGLLADRLLSMAPWGRMDWQRPHIMVSPDPIHPGGYRLSTDRPVPSVHLRSPGATLSDNDFFLMPGMDRWVQVVGGEPPTWEVWPP